MISDELAAALAGLSTARIQALVDAVSADEDLDLTMGAWRPHCPMVIAGFDPAVHRFECPERRFARAWDAFAVPAPRHWWARAVRPTARHARRSDVQALLRAANEVLAARQAQAARDTTAGVRTRGAGARSRTPRPRR